MPKMTHFLTSTTLSALPFIILSTNFLPNDAKFSQQLPQTHHVEKLSHLHFYFHDIVSGKQPTSITVTGKKDAFGLTRITDDPLTEEADPGSRVVGRAQGEYTMSSKDGAALFVMMSLVFKEGKYNGSSISILGINHFLEVEREIPIVGGSGAFRFARGYALAKTVKYNRQTDDAVVEYNVFVMHH